MKLATIACPKEILLFLFQASASNLDDKMETLLLAEHSFGKPGVPEKMMQVFPGTDSRDRPEAKREGAHRCLTFQHIY